MIGPEVTVRHDEDAHVVRALACAHGTRIGVEVRAELTYTPGQTQEALQAVDRLAASLRSQIADAAESTARSAP